MPRLTLPLADGACVRIDECDAGSWEGGSVWPPAHEFVALLCAELRPKLACERERKEAERPASASDRPLSSSAAASPGALSSPASDGSSSAPSSAGAAALPLSLLECGAGCGLVGLAAALLGARVVLTDLPVALPTLRSNARLNGLGEGAAEEGGSAVEVAELDWCSPDQKLLEGGRTFDLVLASECLYDADCVLPLLRTLHRACRPDGRVWLGGIIGADVLNRFRRHVTRFFDGCDKQHRNEP